MRLLKRAALLAVLVPLFFTAPVAAAPPYSPDWIGNQTIPTTYPADPNSAAMVATFLGDLQGTRLLYSISGEVPTINNADATDPLQQVDIGSVHTQFRIPTDLKIGTGSDHPTEVLETFSPYRELRVWRAVCANPCTDLTGDNASLSHYDSGSLPYPYVGNATGSNVPYLGGLDRPIDYYLGNPQHIGRFAFSEADTCSTYRWPAESSDSTGGGAGCLPEGAIIQLLPSVVCSTRTAPGHPVTDAYSKLVQKKCIQIKYRGMFVGDNTGSFDSANIYAEDETTANWTAFDDCGTGNLGWMLRSLVVAYGSCPPTRSSDGIPWDQLRVIDKPYSATQWTAP